MQTGCYGDGALGHQHCRESLASEYAMLDTPDQEVIASLHEPMPDDAWDEHEALAGLNDSLDNVTLYWGFQDGDFGLWPIEEE